MRIFDGTPEGWEEIERAPSAARASEVQCSHSRGMTVPPSPARGWWRGAIALSLLLFLVPPLTLLSVLSLSLTHVAIASLGPVNTGSFFGVSILAK